ncbi:MAG TPA: tail fiber domain-containing protein [Terriglobales bacterium]
MKRRSVSLSIAICCLLVHFPMPKLSFAQTPAASATASSLPRLVRFSGTAKDPKGNPLAGMVGITFAFYPEESGSAPLWLETHNVAADSNGHYTVLLGSTQSDGLPVGLFNSEQARWVGVQVTGQPEQPRVLLVSAPYALKAGDAETIGGLPPSAFVLATPPNGPRGTTTAAATGSPGAAPAGSSDVTTSGGTVGMIPYFSTATDIENSVIAQKGSGSSAKVGINNSNPSTTLDIKGNSTVRGTLSLPATKTATATQGYDSQPQQFQASAYDSTTGGAVSQNFQWQAEPINNDTGNASGTWNLLFAQGSNAPAETGLHVASNGQITFASGQTFPGTGDGTITGVTAGSGLSGGGTSGKVTLTNTGLLGVTAGSGISVGSGQNPTVSNSGILSVTAGTGISVTSGQTPTVGINTTVVPELGTANTFAGNQTVNGNLSATGVVTGSSYQIGSNIFAFGSFASGNAFLGYAGSTSANQSTSADTAVGWEALPADASSGRNTAIGTQALYSNTMGTTNTACGGGALYENSTGSYNTACGAGALNANTTGSNNTGIGISAGQTADQSAMTGSSNTFLGAYSEVAIGSLTNATAVGANAYVAESNALVLGAGANVGIGTATPGHLLEVDGNATTAQIAMVSTGTDAAISLKNTASGGREYWIDSGSGSAGVGAGNFAIWDNSVGGGPRLVVDAYGHVGIGTKSPVFLLTMADGAYESGGTWTNASDRNLKEGFAVLDGHDVLARLAGIPIESWNYKSEGTSVRHVGPMAQDFFAAFALGSDDRHISTVDEGGVALAAVQQLYREGLQKDEQIRKQQAEIAELMEEMKSIKSSLKTTSRSGPRLRGAKTRAPMIQR